MSATHPMSRFASRLILLCSAVSLVCLAGNATVIAAEALQPVRFRIEWSGGAPRIWSGIVESRDGQFSDPSALGLEADVPGSMWIDGHVLYLQRFSSGVYDGVDATIVGDPQSPVTITLQAADSKAAAKSEPARWRFEFRPGELSAEPRVLTLANSDTRVSLRRAPGDALAVTLDRPHLLFDPGERLTADVAINVRPVGRAAAATFDWKLTPARSDSTLGSGSQSIALNAEAAAPSIVPLDIPLPQQEGVYDVHFSLLGRGLRTETGALQLVVLSRLPLVSFDSGRRDRIVDSFEPSRPGVLRKLEKPRSFREMNEPLGRLLGFTPRQVTNLTTGAEQKVEWSAFKLHVKTPEHPHRLVITMTGEVPQRIGVSLLEPNAAAQLMPIGLDSGVTVSSQSSPAGSTAAEGDERFVTHELLFWPKVREPILLLHDMGTGRPLNVSKVDVIELGALPTQNDRVPLPLSQQRLVGPYLHKPLIPENFGATETYDSPSGRSLDDWVTFYSAGERFIRYLQHENCNSALISVLSDGGTIYPSDLLSPTPRYDTGTFLASGQDPVRKDVLELLYRLFDREGLALIPELQFASPLPVLETELRRGGDAVRGIELIGRDGRSWRAARGTVRGTAPYYNPLDPRVQEAMIDIVRELVARYRDHTAFQGVAVELANIGYMQFPDLEWGYDDETVSRFERETGIQVPNAEGEARFATRYNFLTGQERTRWVQWRCRELARFYQRMSEVVTSVGPHVRFVLSATNVLQSAEPEQTVETSIRSRQSFADLLPPRGLDFKLLADVPRLVVLRPVLPASSDHPSDDVLDEQANHSVALDRAFQAGQPGVLVFRRPREFRISEFDAVSPWEPALTWLAVHHSPIGPKNREPIIHALASNDAQVLFDGGWMIPLGQESQLRDIRDTLLSLPAVPFHLDEIQQQPAVVRLARLEGKTWCYVVNECPDPINVQLRWSCAPGTRSRILPRGTEYPLESDDRGGSRVVVALPAFGLWAFVIEQENARLHEVAVKVPEAALTALKDRVQRLEKLIADANKSAQKSGPRQKALISNPGFESSPESRDLLPGWKLPVENAAAWTLDESNPRSGKSSLLLIADSDDGASLSSKLPVQDDRIVDLYLWLRSDVDDTDVRLVFEATLGEEVFRQEADFHIDTRWRRYRFQVTGIPAKHWDDTQVRVEMRGPGRIWIDDVEAHPQRMSEEDLRQLTRVYSSITLAWDEKRYTDCLRLLESYWSQMLDDAPPAEPSTSETPPTSPVSRTARLKSLFKR